MIGLSHVSYLMSSFQNKFMKDYDESTNLTNDEKKVYKYLVKYFREKDQEGPLKMYQGAGLAGFLSLVLVFFIL